MDEKYHQREMQLQNVVDDVTQRSRQEIISLQRKNDVLIAKKNSEIQRFRMEFLIASPNPSAPLSPEPQDMTDPLSVTTKVCNLPHATILIGVLLNELTK